MRSTSQGLATGRESAAAASEALVEKERRMCNRLTCGRMVQDRDHADLAELSMPGKMECPKTQRVLKL